MLASIVCGLVGRRSLFRFALWTRRAPVPISAARESELCRGSMYLSALRLRFPPAARGAGWNDLLLPATAVAVVDAKAYLVRAAAKLGLKAHSTDELYATQMKPL